MPDHKLPGARVVALLLVCVFLLGYFAKLPVCVFLLSLHKYYVWHKRSHCLLQIC